MKRLFASVLSTGILASAAQADIFHVSNLGDAGPGSLRDAIDMANSVAGPDDIVFDVAGTIVLAANLPLLTDDDTRIRGATAPDSEIGPDITLECSAPGVARGLRLAGAHRCVIEGLRIRNASHSGIILAAGSAENWIGSSGDRRGNELHGNAAGIRMMDPDTDHNNVFNCYVWGNTVGIQLISGASHNQIGDEIPGYRNLINGNLTHGIQLTSSIGTGEPVFGNTVVGNRIGTDEDGAAADGSGSAGIYVEGLCSGNSFLENYVMFNGGHGVVLVAPGNTLRQNVISGNAFDGVRIGPGTSAQANLVIENFIGTHHDGMSAIPNGRDGVAVVEGAYDNEVHQNLISGNDDDGIALYGALPPESNTIWKNFIGTDVTFHSALPNGSHGVHLHEATTFNSIEANVISGNLLHGVYVQGSAAVYTTLVENRIGVGLDGVTPVPNGRSGIRVEGSRTTIGGTEVGQGNVIAANSSWGIEAQAPVGSGPPPVDWLEVFGNRLGVDVDGAPAGNGSGGIWLGDSVRGARIGDDPAIPGAPNVIQHNHGPGVWVGEVGVPHFPVWNTILTNSIAHNDGPGILLTDGAHYMLPSPVITSVTTASVSGENTLYGGGCPGPIRIQVFYTTDDEGEHFLGETFVDEGDPTWTVVGAVPAGANVTATNTADWPLCVAPHTSEFSPPFSVSTGVAYCFGDGLGTPCPWGNDNDGSESGCDWQSPGGMPGGALTAIGSASISANDAILIATNISNDFGIFFGGDNLANGGDGAPLNDGLRCTGGGIARLTPPTLATGSEAMTPSVPALDTGASAGLTRRYQYWFRTSTMPGWTGANLTNGYEITWVP